MAYYYEVIGYGTVEDYDQHNFVNVNDGVHTLKDARELAKEALLDYQVVKIARTPRNGHYGKGDDNFGEEYRQPPEDELPTLPRETRSTIYGLVSSARDEAFWCEDALGISGDSREKRLLDHLLNALEDISRDEAKKPKSEIQKRADALTVEAESLKKWAEAQKGQKPAKAGKRKTNRRAKTPLPEGAFIVQRN